jgi:hypothetical protein
MDTLEMQDFSCVILISYNGSPNRMRDGGSIKLKGGQ